MPDDRGKVTEFDFHDDRGWLSVSLERAAFEKVFKTLQEHARNEELAEIEVSEVAEVLIYDASRRQPGRRRWWNTIYATFVVVFVVVMAILAVIGLIAR